MKKIIGVMTIVALFSSLAIAQTRFPGGITVGTQTQEAAAGLAVGPGNAYIPGTLEVDGVSSLAGAVTSSGIVKGSGIGVTSLTTIASAVPSFVGQIVVGTDYKLYVGSQTVTASWMAQ